MENISQRYAIPMLHSFIPYIPRKSMMLKLFALAVTIGLSAAVKTTFTWKDCATPANRLLNIGGVQVSPTPLVIPGPLTVSFSANLTKQLTSANLIIEVTKNLGFFGYVKVPCLNEIGSCLYDGCAKATQLGSYLSATDNSVYKQIYDMLKKSNINLFGCPIPAPQQGTVTAFKYDIPEPGKQFDWLVNGDYHIIGHIQDKVTKVDYACLDVTIGVMRGTS